MRTFGENLPVLLGSTFVPEMIVYTVVLVKTGKVQMQGWEMNFVGLKGICQRSIGQANRTNIETCGNKVLTHWE